MIPITANIDPQFQSRFSDWKLFNTFAAPDKSIDPNPPAEFELIAAPAGDGTAVMIHTRGVAGEYSGGLAHISRPLLPNTGNYGLAFEAMFSDQYLADSPAQEFDGFITPASDTFMFGFQILQSGALQVWDAVGKVWSPQFPGPGPLSPGVWHRFQMQYSWDLAKNVGTWVGVTIDGVDYPVPEAIRSVPGTALGWQTGCCVVQVQPDMLPTGADYNLIVDNANLYGW